MKHRRQVLYLSYKKITFFIKINRKYVNDTIKRGTRTILHPLQSVTGKRYNHYTGKPQEFKSEKQFPFSTKPFVFLTRRRFLETMKLTWNEKKIIRLWHRDVRWTRILFVNGHNKWITKVPIKLENSIKQFATINFQGSSSKTFEEFTTCTNIRSNIKISHILLQIPKN